MLNNFNNYISLIIFLVVLISFLGLFLYISTIKKKKKQSKVIEFFINFNLRKSILLSSATLHLFISLYFIAFIKNFSIIMFAYVFLLSLIFIIFSMNYRLIFCEIVYTIIEVFMIYLVSLLFEYIHNIHYIFIINVLAYALCIIIFLYVFYIYIRKMELIIKK